MRLHRCSFPEVPRLGGRWAVTLGTFDGVHRGHQAILAESRAVARAHDLDGAVAVSFAHHPRSVLDGARRPRILTTPDEKIRLLAASGLEALVLLDFDEALAALEYDTFVRSILLDRLGLAHFVLGHDVHFGRGRGGNVTTVAALGEAEGFGVSQVASVRHGGEPISSTRIRDLVAGGRLPEAAVLLGHPFPVAGQVVEGRRLGRTLGFPTANLDPGDPSKLLPPLGVYGAWARWDRDWHPAVVNIGLAPTVSDAGEIRVEAHVLEGEWDLYGRRVELALAGQLRAEKKFTGVEALRAQIGRDVEAAQSLLREPPGPGLDPRRLDDLSHPLEA